jgi:hypothetical protein
MSGKTRCDGSRMAGDLILSDGPSRNSIAKIRCNGQFLRSKATSLALHSQVSKARPGAPSLVRDREEATAGPSATLCSAQDDRLFGVMG